MSSGFGTSDYGLGTLHGRPIIGVQRGRGRAFATSLPPCPITVNTAASLSSSATMFVGDDSDQINLGRVIKETLNCGNQFDTSSITNPTTPLATTENTDELLTPISTATDVTNDLPTGCADRTLTPTVDCQRTPTKASELKRVPELPPTQFDFPLVGMPLAANPVAARFNLPQPTAADVAKMSVTCGSGDKPKSPATMKGTDSATASDNTSEKTNTIQPTVNVGDTAPKPASKPVMRVSNWSDDEQEKDSQQKYKQPIATATTTATTTTAAAVVLATTGAADWNQRGEGRGSNFGRGGGAAGTQSARDPASENAGKNDFGDVTGGGGSGRAFGHGGGESASRAFGHGDTSTAFGTKDDRTDSSAADGGEPRPFGRGGFSSGANGDSSRGSSGFGRGASFPSSNNEQSGREFGGGGRGGFSRGGGSGDQCRDFGGGGCGGFNRNGGSDLSRDFASGRRDFGGSGGGGRGFSRGGDDQGHDFSSSCVGGRGYSRSGGGESRGFGGGGRGGFNRCRDDGGGEIRPFGGGGRGGGGGGFGRGGFSSGGDQGRDFGNGSIGRGAGGCRGGRGTNGDGGGCGGFQRDSSGRPAFNRNNRENNADRDQRRTEWASRMDRREEVFRSMRRVPRENANGEPRADGKTRSIGYIPPTRTVENIFEEDSRNADNYRVVADDDEEVALDFKDVTVSVQSQTVVRTIDTWADANLEAKLLENITEWSKYVRPRKIQASCIPYILEGFDVMAHAETGSGKTAAFLIPVINQLMKMERKREPLSGPTPYAIVIEPTRELCDQVWGQGRKLAHETGLTVARAYGSYDRRLNLRELMMGCDILCATPGRLADFVLDGMVCVKKVKFLIMDEVDRLLEASFLSQINGVLLSTNFPAIENRQSLLFSATFPKEVQKLCNDVLKPDRIFFSNKKSDEAERANHRIIQTFVKVDKAGKKDMLLEILCGRAEQSNVPQTVKRTLVFVARKSDTDLLALYLSQQKEAGLRANSINSDRTQQQREEALAQFRDNEIQVLVVTDVCARGIDIKDMDHVINFDMPPDDVTYIHRIGRTGRLKYGFATSFIDANNRMDVDLIPSLVQIIRNTHQDPPQFMKDLLVQSRSNIDDPVSHDNCFAAPRGFGSVGGAAAENADQSIVMNIPVPAAVDES